MGTKAQAGVRHRHQRMRKVQRPGQDHRLHRGSGGDREDSQSPEDKGGQPNFLNHPPTTAASTTLAADVGPGTGGLTSKTTDIMDDAATTIAG